jgi:hypothetical protein
LALISYLNKLSKKHKALRERRDPRRVLTYMSLANIIY